jgi:hypothetical protein
MTRLLAAGVLCVLLLPRCAAAAEDDQQAAKEALRALNDYIGGWKGNGSLPKDARETWKETVSWSWRFKGKDVWLSLAIAKGRYFKSGELRYLVAKKRYQLTLVNKDDKKVVYEGQLKKGRLTLERLDRESKETQQVLMNLAGGGVRFVYTVSHKPANRTLFTTDFQVACTKEGESFGARESKAECVVTGGLGTIAVMHKGVTYYVCCSGCKDAFNEDPEKYIKEYEARKKKK